MGHGEAGGTGAIPWGAVHARGTGYAEGTVETRLAATDTVDA